jgi:hypothetical protein
MYTLKIQARVYSNDRRLFKRAQDGGQVHAVQVQPWRSDGDIEIPLANWSKPTKIIPTEG